MADDAGGAWWRDAGIAARLVAVGVIIRAFEARILTRTAAPGMVLVSIRAELLRAYVKGAMPAGQPWLSALLLWRRSVFRRWSTGNFPRRTILAERAALSGKLKVHSGQLHMKWTTFQRTATRSKTNMIRPIFFVAMLAVLLAVSLSCSSAPDVVRMGTEGAYPPFNFINDDGEVDGLERELGDELCRRANLECTWVTNEWDTIIPNLVDGKYDTILAGMSITDERDEVIDFTQPYIPPGRSVYVALAGDGDEAANGKVAAQVATIQASYLMSQTRVTLLEYKLASEPVEAVLSGEVDAALMDREFAHESMAGYERRLTIVGPEVKLDFGTGVGVREDDGPLKDKLDQAISEMKDDGSLNALIRKWLGHDADLF